MPDLPITSEPTVIVTASRGAEAADATPASFTLIDAERTERLGPPLVTDLLRLSPCLLYTSPSPRDS